MTKFGFFISIFLATSIVIQAQTDNGMLRMDEFRNPKKRDNIIIPDVKGYQTLKCDFHMHTMFSDGLVWPTIRVQEAWQEGLDVIAITDHIEYQPHSQDVTKDHNRSYDIAKNMAAENNIIFIKGTEITRATPPGHFNALFIGDASDYVEEMENSRDKEAINKAVEQDAFIFWNHPGWKYKQIEGSYEWIDFVDELHKEKSLHGIEVFNGFGFHKKALDWCVDNNLTVMGTTDAHTVMGYAYDMGDIIHRTMTLVFAKERTEKSVRDALEAGRTVAWASKYIAGKEEHVKNLFYACVEVSPSFHSKNERNYYEVINNSDLYFEMDLKSGNGTSGIILFPRSTQIITAGEDQKNLVYEVTNAYVRSDKKLIVTIPLK
jgi:predicted metal-dependent phosphoesterase TrpH